MTKFFISSQLNCPCKSSQNRHEKCRRSPDIVTEKCCRVGFNLDNCRHLNCTVFHTNIVTFSESVRDDMS